MNGKNWRGCSSRLHLDFFFFFFGIYLTRIRQTAWQGGQYIPRPKVRTKHEQKRKTESNRRQNPYQTYIPSRRCTIISSSSPYPNHNLIQVHKEILHSILNDHFTSLTFHSVWPLPSIIQLLPQSPIPRPQPVALLASEN